MNSILVVDDDAYIRELVCTLLRDEGFDVCEGVDGKDALKMLSETKVELCILDIMMPNMDGFEFCERARRYHDFPILMLTARGETGQKVRGFEPAELVARVKALLKRYRVSFSQAVQAGALLIDRNSYTVRRDGVGEDIPHKEFELLFLLASYPGKTLSRDRLIEEVWGYDFEGNERTLDVHIGRLRERFPQELCGVRIATIRGLGYRLEVLP